MSGSLVQVHCGVYPSNPGLCPCSTQLCVCAPTVNSCDNPIFPGRPDFDVYAPSCGTSKAIKAGFNVGTQKNSADVVSNGVDTSPKANLTVPVEWNNATFWLSLSSTKSEVLYFQQPQVTASDFLGKVSLSESGNAEVGGMLKPGSSTSLMLRFACIGAESIATVNVRIPIPPFDPISFSFKKICPLVQQTDAPSAAPTVATQYPQSGGTQQVWTSSPTPTMAHHKLNSHIQNDDRKDTNTEGVLFLWFIGVWILLCVCGCVYNHNKGEQGCDIIPGAEYLYRIDDTFFNGKYTSNNRSQFNRIDQTEPGIPHHGVPQTNQEGPSPWNTNGFYAPCSLVVTSDSLTACSQEATKIGPTDPSSTWVLSQVPQKPRQSQSYSILYLSI